MIKTVLKSFTELIEVTTANVKKGDMVLFRGQPSDYSLLPKIVRTDPSKDTTEIEKQMLSELKRRAGLLIDTDMKNDWDLLVYAQHYGMNTRLLDWTTNPLIGLWFACNNVIKNRSSYIYTFIVSEDFLLDPDKEPDPFTGDKTRVFKPNSNNPRIAAQNSWFTCHRYSTSHRSFIPLDHNSKLQKKIIEAKIRPKLRANFLAKLDMLGINHQSVFPDFEGVCRHVNWLLS